MHYYTRIRVMNGKNVNVSLISYKSSRLQRKNVNFCEYEFFLRLSEIEPSGCETISSLNISLWEPSPIFTKMYTYCQKLVQIWFPYHSWIWFHGSNFSTVPTALMPLICDMLIVLVIIRTAICIIVYVRTYNYMTINALKGHILRWLHWGSAQAHVQLELPQTLSNHFIWGSEDWSSTMGSIQCCQLKTSAWTKAEPLLDRVLYENLNH